MHKLTYEEKQILEAKLKKAREASERNRLCVILGYDEGLSLDELTKALRIDLSTVYNYLRDYDSDQKTKNSPRGGTKSKLTEDQSQSLSKHLTDTTYLKVKDICAHVEKEYGVLYSRTGMTDWLQQHAFTFKRPKKVPGKLDPLLQEAFIQKYNELKALLKKDEEIYFLDAVHPEHQSQAVSGWIKKGLQKTLQTTGKQLRLHFVGALNLQGMRIFTQEYETVDTDAMLDFFEKLEKQSAASTIYVIMDNAKANKNKKIDEYLATSRIKAYYLPPYSPNLNPIERLWKVMRETKLYNRYIASSVDFFREIRGFFQEDIPKMTDILTSRINDKFQPIRLDPVRIRF